MSSIYESLVSVRNILLGGRSNDEVLHCLEETINNLGSIKINSTKLILKRCVSRAILKVRESKYVEAGMIVDLVHNLPLDSAAEQSWDIDYFLSYELLEFLEAYDDIEYAREIVLYVCQQLATRYCLQD